MREIFFETIGYLPAAKGRWHVRKGGGYLWFVNEDPDVKPQCIVDDVVTPIVDAATDPDAPLIVPKATVD